MHAVQTLMSSTSELAVAEPLPQKVVAKLFASLGGQLGAKIADLYAGVKSEIVQSEWARGLAGFTRAEIVRGMAESRTRRFAPTLGEFAQMCRPAIDPECAWLEAVDGLAARDNGQTGDWSHPAVYRAAMACSFDIRNRSFQTVRRTWEWRLRKEFAQGWGDDVPAVPIRVEHRPTLKSMPATVKQRLANLVKQTGNKK
jgi:hypothetical protein